MIRALRSEGPQLRPETVRIRVGELWVSYSKILERKQLHL